MNLVGDMNLFDYFKQLWTDKQKDVDIKQGVSSLVPTDGRLSNTDSLEQGGYRVASCQSSGVERYHNEDTVFTLSTMINDIALPAAIGIFMIADGMGGHQSGEVASRLAVETVSRILIDELLKAVILDHRPLSENDCSELLKAAFSEAQDRILQQVPGGGTTLTLAVGIGNKFFSAHVGDSRLYKIDLEGKIHLQTKDHSLVKRLVDLGEISQQEASNHPQRNVLYKAIGQSDPFQPDIDQYHLQAGERLLICSDGLWGVLSDGVMEEIIKEIPDLDCLAVDLVNKANAGGGPDNISVILVERIA